MFDWPDASHTSPTRTSLTVSVVPPFTVSVCGSPAASSGSSFNVHWPSASAFVAFDFPAMETVTSSPGAAQPHTATAASLCKTM